MTELSFGPGPDITPAVDPAQNVLAAQPEGFSFNQLLAGRRKQVVTGIAVLAAGAGVAVLASGGGESNNPLNTDVAVAAAPAAESCDQPLDLSANQANKTFASRVGLMPSLLQNNSDKLLGHNSAVSKLREQTASDGRVAAILSEVYDLRDDHKSPDTLTKAGIKKAFDTLNSSKSFADGRVSYICQQLDFVETDEKFAVVGGNAGAIQLDHSEQGIDAVKIVAIEKDRVIRGQVIGFNEDTKLDDKDRAFNEKFKQQVIIDAETGEIVILNLKAPESQSEKDNAQGGGKSNGHQQKGDSTEGQDKSTQKSHVGGGASSGDNSGKENNGQKGGGGKNGAANGQGSTGQQGGGGHGQATGQGGGGTSGAVEGCGSAGCAGEAGGQTGTTGGGETGACRNCGGGGCPSCGGTGTTPAPTTTTPRPTTTTPAPPPPPPPPTSTAPKPPPTQTIPQTPPPPPPPPPAAPPPPPPPTSTAPKPPPTQTLPEIPPPQPASFRSMNRKPTTHRVQAVLRSNVNVNKGSKGYRIRWA